MARAFAPDNLWEKFMKRDLREYARNTNIRLAIGAFFLLFVVGTALIYFIYGPAAAAFGFLCLLGGLIPLALIFLVMYGMDWIVKNARPK
jgi:Sec-independent protein secretion pathway component TatC